MGFLGEIERRKQQQLQQELARKAEAERQQKIIAANALKAAQKSSEAKKRVERIPMGFIRDSATISNLLDQLYQFGYKGYFEQVSEISGFPLSILFYTEYPERYLGADGRIPGSSSLAVLLEKGSETTRQQLRAEERLKDASLQLGWHVPDEWNSKSPNVMFFADNVSGKEEPKEVGICLHFSKRVKIKSSKVSRSKYVPTEPYHYSSIFEEWSRDVYVRIDSHNGATITGSSQRQVALNNVRTLDEVLERAIRNPAKVHAKTIEHKTMSPPYRQDGGPCLPGNSLISVPGGSMLIKNLKSGDLVWTVDKFGHKVQAPIVQRTKRIAAKNHKVAYIVLKDGRELIVSPGHPTIDNRELGSLKEGKFLDQSEIISLRITSYKEKYTYDILPSGDTGGYWANNILIGSTLSSKFKKMKVMKINDQTSWGRQLFEF